MKIYELFTELSSEKRYGILQALDEKPMKFTSLSSEVDVTSAEASRQLARLTEAQLIEKKGDGNYDITPLGKLVLAYISGLDFVMDKSEYFLTHDTSPIPQKLLSQIDALSNGEIVTGVYEILNIHEKLGDGLKEYFWYMSDDFPRHHLPKIEETLDEGVEIKVILPKDLVTTLKPILSEKIRTGMEARTLDEVKIAAMITESSAMFGLPEQGGKVDHDAIIIGSDSRFKEWCRELFEYYWEKAKPQN